MARARRSGRRRDWRTADPQHGPDAAAGSLYASDAHAGVAGDAPLAAAGGLAAGGSAGGRSAAGGPAPFSSGTRPGSMPAPGRREGTLRAGSTTRGWIPAAALLPLRLFAGFTFLYAGLDKLAFDPTFLDLSSRTSILAQLRGYEHTSPLAPLITALAIPNAWFFGVLIALAEIAVGLGVLTGLAFRLSALGGAFLSAMFFLTASWTVHPYYFGQDLPYLMGFVTLAAAGHGDLYVLGPWVERRFLRPAAMAGRRGAPPVSPERRLAVQAIVLAIAAIAVAVLARPLRALLPIGDGTSGGSALGAPGASTPASIPAASQPASSGQAAASTAPGASAGANAGGGPQGSLTIASTSQVAQAGSAQFTVPSAVAAKDSSGAVQPGDPGIVVALSSGSFVAFDAVCTHAGCTVGWDPQAGLLLCPCHGAAFDPHNKGQVVNPPAQFPLTELPITVANGQITLRA